MTRFPRFGKPGLQAPRSGSLAVWARRATPLEALRDPALLSRRLWQDAKAVLPAPMVGAIQPGRLQDGIWTLTASSSAVAAKLSQFKPRLLHALRDQGHPLQEVRIRVRPSSAAGSAVQPQPVLATTCPEAVRKRFAALRQRFGK